MSLRKALLVGINAYQDAPLRGCINDVLQMKGLLQRYYGFVGEGIRLFVGKEAEVLAARTPEVPGAKEMLDALVEARNRLAQQDRIQP